jgi:hypothetical protein
LCVVAFSSSAAAQSNPFIIDGVVPANGMPVPPPEIVDPFGSVQELGAMNASSTKVGVINTDLPVTLDFTNPNGQVDLRRVWTQTTKTSDGHVWLYFAWERDASSGSGFIAYEFQQAQLSAPCVYTGTGIDLVKPQSAAETTLISNCNPWAGRQAGDFMIMWDQSGSALTINKRVFNGVAFGPIVSLGTVVPAISADGFRGEAAIDLTTDVFPSNACVSFANIIPGTVTGNSDSADYKDTVLARFEPVSNCGTLTVKKVTVPSDLTGSFEYTVARTGGAAINFAGATSATGTLTFDGDIDTHLNLLGGDNYTLAEAAQVSPWQLTSIICTPSGGTPVTVTGGATFAVQGGSSTACVITNTRKTGTIKVIKTVINNNGLTSAANAFTISLGDGQTPTTFPGNAGGTVFTFDEGYAFNVAEIAGPAGWDGPAGYTVSYSGTCSGQIIANQEQVCTVTNDDKPAKPTGATVQRVILHDTLNVTGIRAGGAQLTATFRLYSNDTCSVQVGSAETVNVSAGGVATTVAGVGVNAGGTYYWRVEFSGNANNETFTTACKSEISAVTFTPVQ